MSTEDTQDPIPTLTVNFVKNGHTSGFTLPMPPSVPRVGDKFTHTAGEIVRTGEVSAVEYHYFNGIWITTVTVTEA